MASLLVIGGILLAAKYADEHAEKKNRDVGPDSDNYSKVTLSKTSKRDKLKPKYWHSRRKARTDAQPLGICESSPPPYAELPAVCHIIKTANLWTISYLISVLVPRSGEDGGPR